MAAKLPNTELTSAEKKALDYYRSFVDAHGVSPSVRAVAAHLGVWPNSAHRILRNLAAKGYLLAREDKKVTITRLRLSAKGKKAPL